VSTPKKPSDDASFAITGERSVAEVLFLDVAMLTVAAPDGTTFERVAIRHPGAVGIVPLDDEGAVLLIEQYRAPVDETILEIPAGKLDVDGEDPAVAAVRELEEELGYTAGNLEPLMSFYTGPGFTDEVIHLYLGTELTAVPHRPHGVEEEAARLVRIPVDELSGMLAAGRVKDAKTIAGLQALLLRSQ
jgi:8-oxo-dGTP pyrophosphatase MutT (NUDIX family)